MAKKNYNYPYIAGPGFNKGLLGYRREDGDYVLMFCRLNKDYPSGVNFALDDVESVEKEIWFTNIRTMELTVEVLNKMLADWKMREAGMIES